MAYWQQVVWGRSAVQMFSQRTIKRERKREMSQPSENEAQTPQELRETLLSEIEASQQAMSELSDEQVEEIVGGINGATRANVMYLYKQAFTGNMNHISREDMRAIRNMAYEEGKAGNRIR
jgi:hypothetical protein